MSPPPVPIVVEFPRPLPRGEDLHWAASVAAGLAAHGREGVVLCDAEGDTGRLAAMGVRAVRRRPNRAWRDRSPRDFPRWAREQIKALGALRVVSLHALVAGDVWAPVQEPAASELAWAISRPGLATRLFETLQRPGVATAAVLEPRVRRAAAQGGRTPTRFGIPSGATPNVLPAAGRFGVVSPERTLALRDETRRAFGIDQSTFVAAPIAQSGDRDAMRSALAGIARLPGAVALLAGRASRTLDELAEAAGLAGRVVHAGGTSRADAVFAASDVVVKAGERPSPRLLGEALSVGCPIAIDGRDPDAPALREHVVGAIAVAPRDDLWEDAIGTAGALQVSRAGREVAAMLTPEALGRVIVERLA